MSKAKNTFLVRPERDENDFNQIHQVTVRAFGGEGEARLVAAMREDSCCFIPELSLVATTTATLDDEVPKEDRIVGHVMFSRISIIKPSDSAATGSIPCLALAPVSVDPQFQKQGVGSMLVRHGIQLARTMSHKIIVVLGDPRYYSRFGFETAKEKRILCPYPNVPDEYFMVLGLTSDAFEELNVKTEEVQEQEWMVKYSPAFDVL